MKIEQCTNSFVRVHSGCGIVDGELQREIEEKSGMLPLREVSVYSLL